MFGFLGWILMGLFIGAIAKFVMPGRDPGGIVITTLLGIAGAAVGGWIGTILGFYRSGEPAGFLMAVLGAVTLLFLYRTLTRQTA